MINSQKLRTLDHEAGHNEVKIIKGIWNFSSQPHYGPGFDSTSNRNEYQDYFLGVKGGRCLGLTTLPPSYGDCLEIWETQLSGTLRASPGV
jgi:hypothetical protein